MNKWILKNIDPSKLSKDMKKKIADMLKLRKKSPKKKKKGKD